MVPAEECVAVRPAGRTTVVELRGEIDRLTVPAVTGCLDGLTTREGLRLVVDLRPVTFIDCTGLGALTRARRRVTERHGVMSLVVRSERVLRTLRLTGLADAFPLYPHLAGALRGPAERPLHPPYAFPAAAAARGTGHMPEDAPGHTADQRRRGAAMRTVERPSGRSTRRGRA